MKKRIVSIVLILCLAFGTAVPAFAQGTDKLSFDENGEFRILHLCDCQDGYPASKKMFTYIEYMIKLYEPDLVVLGGDNTVSTKETKEDAIKELVAPFVENKVYFTLVFGNHDDEQGVDKDTLLALYQKHGGEYCLAYDAVPALSGTANHNLPVYSSDGSAVKFNVWMLDTGTYVYDELDGRLGYDSVRKDQIEWYETTSKALEAKAGKKVPSMVFQHMVVQEVYDAMFPEVPLAVEYLTEDYSGKTFAVILPDTSKFKGHIYEPPSPGYYNFGEFESMKARGDVLAIFAGHDHYNTYEIEHEGIMIINSPAISYNAYGNEVTRGSRLITVNESNPEEFVSEVITVNDLAAENSEFAEAADISRAKAKWWRFLGKLLLGLSRASSVISRIIYD